MSDWADYVEPAYVPGPSEAFLFFGAQVGHSPEREQPPPSDATCPLCRGDIDAASGLPGSVCSKCMAWNRDGRLSVLMLTELANRGDFGPLEKVWLSPYREPIDPREIDPDTGRPAWEGPLENPAGGGQELPTPTRRPTIGQTGPT